MRDAGGQETAEEDFCEFSYLLSLPADPSTNEFSLSQDRARTREIYASSVRSVTHSRCKIRPNGRLPSSGSTAGHVAAHAKKPECKGTPSSSSCWRPHAGRRLQQRGPQTPLHRLSQCRTQQTSKPHEPHGRPERFQQQQDTGGRQEAAAESRAPQCHEDFEVQEGSSFSQKLSMCCLEEKSDTSIFQACQTRTSCAAGQRNRAPANDVVAAQRRRREALVAATVTSKNELELYKERRRLLAAKEEAARQEEIEKSRQDVLERLRIHHAEQQRWRQQQEEESRLLVQLQQELDQRQAEQVARMKLLQAARAAAALRTLAAERAARDAAAEDGERRRNRVKRMGQIRATAQRAKAAAALQKERISRQNCPPSQQALVSPTAAVSPTLAAAGFAAAKDTNSQYKNCEGAKPRLLSVSTARRVALRQQQYSNTFLHRMIVDGAPATDDQGSRKFQVPALGPAQCSFPTAASLRAPGSKKSSTSTHLDVDDSGRYANPQPPSSTGVAPRLFTSLRRISPKPTGESAHKQVEKTGDTLELRLAEESQETFATSADLSAKCTATSHPPAAAETFHDITNSEHPSAAPQRPSGNRDSLRGENIAPDGAFTENTQLVKWWRATPSDQSSRNPLRIQSGNSNTSNSTCSAVSAPASTVSTTPRAASSVTVRTSGGRPFCAQDLTPCKREHMETEQPALSAGNAPLTYTDGDDFYQGSFCRDTMVSRDFPSTCVSTFLERVHTVAGISDGVHWGCCDVSDVSEMDAGEALGTATPCTDKREAVVGDFPVGASSQELSRRAPQLVLLDTSTDVHFDGKRRTNLANASACNEAIDHGIRRKHCNTHCIDSAYETINVTLDSGAARDCSGRDNGRASTHPEAVAPSLYRAGQKNEIRAFSETDLAVATQGREAVSTNKTDDGNVIILHPIVNSHAKTGISTYTPNDASSTARGVKKRAEDERSSAAGGRTTFDSSSAQRKEEEIGSRDDHCHDGGYSGPLSEKAKATVALQPCFTSFPSVAGVEMGPKTKQDRRSRLQIAVQHGTNLYCGGNSPCTSPRAYRCYDTPNFGVRLASSLVGFSDADGSSRSPSANKPGPMDDSEAAIIDYSGSIVCVPSARSSYQREPQTREEREAKEKELRQHQGQEHERNLTGVEEAAEPESLQPLSKPAALQVTATSKKRDTALVAASNSGDATAAGSASDEPAPYSNSVLAEVNGFSECSRAAPESLLQPSRFQCREKPPLSDFSERVRMRQQQQYPIQQQSTSEGDNEEDYNSRLLQLQSLSSQLNALCSSSSSSDLHNSNGNCCCQEMKAGDASAKGLRHSLRTKSCSDVTTACDPPVVHMLNRISEADATINMTAVADNTLSDGSAGADVTDGISVEWVPDRQKKLNCMRIAEARKRLQDRQRQQRRWRGLGLHRREGEEHPSDDGAEADAESNVSSASEMKAPSRREERQEDEKAMHHCESIPLPGVWETEGELCGRTTCSDADRSASTMKTHGESREPNAESARVSSSSTRCASQKTEDDEFEIVQTNAPTTGLPEEGVFLRPNISSGRRALRLQQRGMRAGKGGQDGVAKSSQDQKTASTLAAVDAGVAVSASKSMKKLQQNRTQMTLECHTSFFEGSRQHSEAGGSEAEETGAAMEPQAVCLQYHSFPTNSTLHVQQHAPQQQPSLPLEIGEGAIYSVRRLQQLSGYQCTKETTSASSADIVSEQHTPYEESGVSALLDEFFEVGAFSSK